MHSLDVFILCNHNYCIVRAESEFYMNLHNFSAFYAKNKN